MEQPDRFVLSANLIQAILNYMVSKPYSEVGQMINAIQAQVAPQLPPPPPEESAAGASSTVAQSETAENQPVQ